MEVKRIIQVYEQLLAQNPAYRKKIGAFYTPEFIVNYMVDCSLKKCFENKTQAQIQEVRLIDPACGGGAFLVGAYEYLLNYFSQSQQKILNLPERKAILFNHIFGVDIDAEALQVCKQALLMVCFQTDNPTEIDTELLNQNIKCGNSLVSRFAIDSDLKQITQNLKTHGLNRGLFELSEKEKKEKAKKADLISNEIAKLEAEIEEIKSNKIFENAFEWRFEFPEVLNDDGDFMGFDVVIGNPPYIRQEEIKDLKFFLQNHYEVYHGLADLYVYFIEKSIQIAANNGIISQITNNKWLIAGYGEPLRKLLLQKRLLEIINFGDQQVFIDATTYPAILSLKKEDVSLYKSNATTALPERISEMVNLFKAVRDVGELPEPVKQSLVIDDSIENTEIFANNIKQLLNYKKELNGLFTILQQTLDEVQNLRYQLVEQIQFRLALFNEEPSTNITRYISDNSHTVLQNDLTAEPWIIGKSADDELLKKINLKCTNLEKYVKNSYRGVLTGLTEAFVIDRATKDRLVAANSRNNDIIKPFLAGRDIKKYQSPIIDKFLILFPKGFTNENRQLKDNSNHIIANDAWVWVKVNYPAVVNHLISFQSKAENRTDKGDYWWELRACDYYDMFEKPKIMYQVLQVKPCFIYDEEGLFCNNSMWFIPSNDKVLLGILNSKMGWWLIAKYCTAIQNGYQLIWKYFSQIPIAIGNVTTRTKIIDIVNQILITKKQNPAANTTALEAEIDQLVYQLYDLTEEEIRIIEGV